MSVVMNCYRIRGVMYDFRHFAAYPVWWALDWYFDAPANDDDFGGRPAA